MVTVCYKQKSTLIKCLIFLVSVLIMILVGLALVLVKRNEDNHVCKSDHCIKLSAELLRSLDQSRQPCDDFYAFTCGLTRNRKEIPPASTKEVLNFMVGEMVQSTDSKPFIMEKSFYLACSNLAGIELDDDEWLLDQFFSLGDWPVLRGSNWDGSYFEWTEIVKKSRKLGMKIDWFVDFSIYEDVNDTRINVLKIDIPALTPLKESEVFPRQKLLTKIAVTLGAPEKLAHYETGRTIEFEKELRMLAHVYRSRKTHLNAITLPKITISEVQKLCPHISWLDLINGVTGVTILETDVVILDEMIDYIKDLNKLIYGTPKRIVADYMMWKVVEENWQFLTQPVRQKFEEYYEEQHQIQPELDRQKFCINASRKQFPLIVESEYIRRHVTLQKRQLVKEMLINIQRNYRRLLHSATWMNRKRRDLAMRKLDELKFLIGGPREVFDEFGFAEDLGLYEFVFKSTNIIDMLNQRKLRFYDHYFSSVNKAVMNRTLKFYEKVININRFTLINDDTLVIPAALLKDNFYDPNLPNNFNYATLGKSLAHKIFEHIFERNNVTIIDEETQNYNTWWISDGFDQAVKCLIHEASDFHNPELKRQKKMRELLAHFVSTEVAYESFKELLTYRQDSPQSKLQSLQYTPEQLFWIHTSKLHCNKIYSKYDRDYSRFKIIAPLRNSRNFARDYNCQMGSKMYSKKTCRIM